jgi:chromosome segregation ATPase
MHEVSLHEYADNSTEAERKEAKRKEAERRQAELRQEVNTKMVKAMADVESARQEKVKALAEVDNARMEKAKALSEAESARQEAECARQEKAKALTEAGNVRQQARDADAERRRAVADVDDPRQNNQSSSVIVGGSAGRLRELSARRPSSAEEVPSDPSTPCWGLSRVSWPQIDHKPSFYIAVKEYERNLASLRKERGVLLNSLSLMRQQLDAAEIATNTRDEERQMLKAARERSTAASVALNQNIEQLSAAHRRIKHLEKQLQDSENCSVQERSRLTTRAESAERRGAGVSIRAFVLVKLLY